MKKLILIDGHSIFFRAYYATAYSRQGLMQNKDGLYTNALFAFVNMIEKILEEDYSHILITFDTSKPTRRHLAYDGYKAGREKMPDEMRVQTPLIHEYLKHKNIKTLAIDGFEADDIIGTFAKEAEKDMKVDIYSSDRDLLQLISDNVTVKLIKRGLSDVEAVTPELYFEQFGISHKYIVDLKGLMGDPSDNIPGVKGVGEKTAIKLIKEYGSLESIMAQKENIKGKLGENLRNEEENAYLSYDLARIDLDVPVEMSIDEVKKTSTDEDSLIDFYRRMDLNSLIKRIEKEEFNLFSQSFDEDVEEEVKTDTIVIETEQELIDVIKADLAIHLEFYDSNYHTSDILGIGISNGKNTYFVDVEMALNTQEFVDYLNSNTPKITYDYKAFKVAMLWRGFDLNGVTFDMLLASYLLHSQMSNTDFKTVSSNFDYDDGFYDDVVYGRGRKKSVPEKDVLIAHVANKAKGIYLLKDKITNSLIENDLVELHKLELDVATVLSKMEYAGIKVDQSILNEQKDLLNTRINELEEEIILHAGKKFNIKSPKQLGEVLFEDLKLEPTKKTATKRYSTNAEVLNSLKDDHPIINPIIEYRQVTKLYSTYIEGIENALFSDSKLHTIYTQVQTATGRLSSIEPNLQNIPVRTNEGRQIRKFFVSENDHVFIGADYSQIELRVLAHMSNSEQLIDDFNNGLDIHSQTAKKVFDTSEVTPLERHKAKAVNFGIIYGMGPWSLAEDINTSVEEARNFIDKYFEVYPEIKTFMDKTVQEAKDKGFVKTIKNRRRYIPELKSPIYNVREFGRRTAMNAPIQGSAADIIKQAMVDLDKYLSENNLKAKILLQVHDELILEVPNEEVDIVKKGLKEVMEKAVKLKVKLETAIDIGSSWYELD